MNFQEMLANAPRAADGSYHLSVSADWANGRTSFGGWVCAMAYNAARLLGEGGDPALPPLRSAMISFIGPVFADFTARPRLLRQGRNATWISVELEKDGAVVLTATFLFMRPLESQIMLENLPMPLVTARPGDLPRMQFGGKSRMIEFFETYPANREPPEDPVHSQWVRLTDRAEMDVQSELLMIGDFCPPGFWSRISERGPVCSMTWQANLLGDISASPDGFWLIRTESHHTEAGANSQLMQVWDSTGRAVLAGQQSTALFM